MKRWWVLFGACALATGLALVWVTLVVLRLEDAEHEAKHAARQQELVRLALWRMDSFLAPRLAREAARPYFEYFAYYPQERAYTAMLSALEAGEVVTASPLLTFTSELFPLHFQLDADGHYTSPQTPVGNQLDLALATCTTGPVVDRHADLLAQVSKRLSPAALAEAVSAAVRIDLDRQALDLLEGRSEEPGQSRAAEPRPQEAQALLNQKEFSKRAQNIKGAREADVPPQVFEIGRDADVVGPLGVARSSAGGNGVAVGDLVPLWTGPDDDLQLQLARRVQVGDAVLHQGFLVDWERLRAALLAEIEDLLPGASLVPVRGGAAEGEPSGRVLASIPALLEAPLPGNGAVPLFTPVRWALGLTWLACLLALGTVGATLRASIALGERRSRFASAVTHELRTPLTTFRMYSEMLADDMVPDPAQRREYLTTLKEESDRLARLVENVLAYARLEEGRSPTRLETVGLADLLARVRPALDRRAADGAMTLEVDVGELAGTCVRADVSVVGQILFNLVDNAAKYAAGGTDPRIELGAVRADGHLALTIRDHGPGVPAGVRRRIFRPFERQAPDATPGVGLGLALSRGLARELGGDLLVDPCPEGACFRLELPITS